MDNRELGWGGMDWIYLAEDRDQWRDVVSTVMNLQVPYNFGNYECHPGSNDWNN
jgi:hypothetical protein